MKIKKIAQETIDIQDRFFMTIDKLIEMNKISGLQPFCAKYGLNPKKYSSIRSQIRGQEGNHLYKIIDIQALAYLARDYKVSAKWLLTGKRSMFSR